MRQPLVFVLLLLVCAVPAMGSDLESRRMSNWHQWRGPLGCGVAPEADPPVTWDEHTNVRWKTAIVGEGSATPIVWDDRVFVLTAIKTDRVDPMLPKAEDQPDRLFGITHPNVFYQFVVVCLDRWSGKIRWKRAATEQVPHEGRHPDNTFSSASPTTDGKRLYVWFGTPGFFCYDLEGNLLWQRDLGPVAMRRSFGEAASPVVHGDTVVVVRDQEQQSYIVALDAGTGKTRWKVLRDEPSAWATPLVVEHKGRTQVITNASNRVRSYDLSDGTLVWQCGGQVGNVTPSPVADEGEVYCMSGYRGSAAYAIDLDSYGDVTGSDRVAWALQRSTPYVPSPLLYDQRLYFNQSNDAILSCVDAATGQAVIERTRMPGLRQVYASPVGAAGRIYFVGRSGTTLVIRHGGEFEVLTTNPLGEAVDASPALVGDQLFLRGQRHVYCITDQGG